MQVPWLVAPSFIIELRWFWPHLITYQTWLRVIKPWCPRYPKLRYFEWSAAWQITLLWFLTSHLEVYMVYMFKHYFLTFHLTFLFLTFHLTFLFLTFCSGIISGIYSGILSGIYSDMFFSHLQVSGILSDKLSSIYSDILYGIYSIYSGVLSGIQFWHSSVSGL